MSQIITATPTVLTLNNQHYPCIIGRNGLVHAEEKREGDYKTPIGTWPLRALWYRIDRTGPVACILPSHIISPDDGWCDESSHSFYNQAIKLPFEASHEILWRDDHAYDLVIVLGYNDNPVIAGKGSAIFIHCMHDDGRPTAGCIALNKKDILALIATIQQDTSIEIAAL